VGQALDPALGVGVGQAYEREGGGPGMGIRREGRGGRGKRLYCENSVESEQ
jgi:hypothetical protein